MILKCSSLFLRQTAICSLERKLNEVWQARCISEFSAISKGTFFLSGNVSLLSTFWNPFKGGRLISFIFLYFKPHSIFINGSWPPVVCADSISRWFKMAAFYFKTGYFMNLFCTGYSFLYPLPFLRHYKFRKVFTAPIGDHSHFSPVNIILVAISIPCECSQSNYMQSICGFPYREPFFAGE